jgi:rare lipoprotein A
VSLVSPNKLQPLSIAAILLPVLVAGCAGSSTVRKESTAYSPRVVAVGAYVPKGGGRHKLGSPYSVGGIVYVPRHEPDYDRIGTASWYGQDFHGRRTANGEIYDMNRLTAAHPTLPLPSLVEVTNLENGRRLIVRVNDRGPFRKGRIIDLSSRTAELLEMRRAGTARVRVRYISPARLDGDDSLERRTASGLERFSRPTPRSQFTSLF